MRFWLRRVSEATSFGEAEFGTDLESPSRTRFFLADQGKDVERIRMDANRVAPAWLRSLSLLALLLLLSASPSAAASEYESASVIYVSPSPGARLLQPETGLIIRFDRDLDARSNFSDLVSVTGERSGPHALSARLSDDRRTVVLRPERAFEWGERVTVHSRATLDLEGRRAAGENTFTFSIAPRRVARPLGFIEQELDDSSMPGPFPSLAGPANATWGIDSIPDDFFPVIQTHVYGTPSPGKLFLAGFSTDNSRPPMIMILNNDGYPVFYRVARGNCFDFKLQPTGVLTYYDTGAAAFLVLNAAYVLVDSIKAGNGYDVDLHELRMLPNGHVLLMSYDYEPVDMSVVVPGGNPNATVVGLMIQELDVERNVVFQWRSWDYYDITDAIHLNLKASLIDYVHGNALELDDDGNILVSCRHMDEITKINRTTGAVMWRWGGKHNEFTFEPDPVGNFTYQHAIRRLDNGNFTLWDNGNYHVPAYSRAIEYQLDESDRVATRIWEYHPAPPGYSFAMGYVQRLPDGHTLMSPGFAKPDVIEVDAEGNKVMDLTLPQNYYTYRAFRFVWETGSWPVSVDAPASTPLKSYPNPARARSSVEFTLAKSGPVSLDLYDVRGRRVRAVYAAGFVAAGPQHVNLDVARLPAGVYFLRLASDGRVWTHRLAVVR